MARRQSAGEIITHSEDDKMQQPDKAGSGEHTGQKGAVSEMHKVDHHQRRFNHRDCERDGGVKRPEIDECHSGGG